MKRSVLRRMSSTPLPEFDIENLKIEEPEKCTGKTGEKFVYTVRHCSFGIDGSDQLEVLCAGPGSPEAIIEEHQKLLNAITISFVPLCPGTYQLFIFHRGEKFFTGKEISVEGKEIIPEEVIDKVKLVGVHKDFGYVQHINEFVVDASECPNFGGIFASIRGLTPRTAAKLYLTDHQNGIYTIGYKPTLNGEYLLKIKMCGLDIPNTPLRIHAQN